MDSIEGCLKFPQINLILDGGHPAESPAKPDHSSLDTGLGWLFMERGDHSHKLGKECYPLSSSGLNLMFPRGDPLVVGNPCGLPHAVYNLGCRTRPQ